MPSRNGRPRDPIMACSIWQIVILVIAVVVECSCLSVIVAPRVQALLDQLGW